MLLPVWFDAETELIRDWYIERFLMPRRAGFHDPASYFRPYADLRHDDKGRGQQVQRVRLRKF